MDFKSTLSLQGVAVLTESTGYTQSELSTSGQSSVHWDNVTNVPSFAVLTEESDQVFAGNLVLMGGPGQKYLAVIAADNIDAGLAAYGTNGQSAGYAYVGSSATRGGGMFVNATPLDFADNERSTDQVSFYRVNGTSKQVVFSYPYDSSDVLFEGAVTAEGNGSFDGVNVGVHPYHTFYESLWRGSDVTASNYVLKFNVSDTHLNARTGSINFNLVNATKAYLNSLEFGADSIHSLGDLVVDDDATINGSADIGNRMQVRSANVVSATVGYTGWHQLGYLSGNLYYESGDPYLKTSWKWTQSAGTYSPKGALITLGGNSRDGICVYGADGNISQGSSPTTWYEYAKFQNGEVWLKRSAWTTVSSFQNTWTAHGSYPVQYTKDANGFVHLRGLLVRGSTEPAYNVSAFNLPVGYRPTSLKLLIVANHRTNASNIGNELRIDTGGYVYPSAGATGAGSGWISLDGVSFYAG